MATKTKVKRVRKSRAKVRAEEVLVAPHHLAAPQPAVVPEQVPSTVETPVAVVKSAVTRSDSAKAAMKSGFLKAREYGNPTKQQCLIVFTVQQYAHSWTWREEKLGVTPELFKTLLAKREKIAVPEKKKIYLYRTF